METTKKHSKIVLYFILYIIAIVSMYMFYDWFDNTINKACKFPPEMYSTMNECHYSSHNYQYDNTF